MEADEEPTGAQIPEFVNKVSHEAKLKELLRNLTSTQSKLCSDAAKELKKLLKSELGPEFLSFYIQISPKFVEFLQAWDLHKGKPGFSHFLKLISSIFSYDFGKDNNNRSNSASDKFARIIVDEKMGDLYKELNSKEAKRQNAVLMLLGSIVRRGPGLAWEVSKGFDFKMGIFQKLAEWKVRRDEGKRRNFLTRKAFVGFAMSFLEVGNPRLLRGILQEKNMYSGVLRGLGNDDEETVVYVLVTLRDRVLVPESLVPPGLRSVLFGSATLEQLISISGCGDGGVAAEVAHNVLIMVCTDPSNGLMPDLERLPSPLKGNPKRLLDLMKKLRATDVEFHKDLLLAIVKGRPAFGSAYLDEFPYKLEDLASPNWLAAISLAANVMSSVGDGLAFGFVNTQLKDPPSFDHPDVQAIVMCIGPRPFTRLVINKGLLHSDPLVKHGTLRLVFEELKLLDALISALNGVPHSNGQMMHKWASLKQDIQNGVRILLPDPQVLLSLLSSLNSFYKSLNSSLKRLADVEVALEQNLSKRKKLDVHIANDDVDILVSGISTSPYRDLDGDDKEVLEEDYANESNSDADLLNPVREIWGLTGFSELDMTTKDGETFFYSKLLDVVNIYHRTLPMAFEGSFDFFRLLPSNPLAVPAILQQSILSMLIEHVAGSRKCENSIRTQPQMYKYLQSFINLFMYSPIRDIKDQAYTLAQAAMLSTGAFDRVPGEICTWFMFIPGYSRSNIYVQNQGMEIFQKLSSTITSFLCDAVSAIGNNLFKYWDLMRRYICNLECAKGISPSFSPFVICFLDKCLRLLSSESGAFTLAEKSLISLYVSTTLKYLLETQVEAGLLASLIDLLLSERLASCCNMSGVSGDSCEWRPLNVLLCFSRNIMHQEIYNRFTTVQEANCSGNSLSSTLAEVEKVVSSEYHDGLVGITMGFSFAMICTTPAEILQNFSSVISISHKLLGIPFSLLSLIFFLEPSQLADLFKLLPNVCFAGVEKNITGVHDGGGNEERNSSEAVDPLRSSAAAAFSLFLKWAPFYVLFPAILFIDGSNLLWQSKMEDLLLAKLLNLTPDHSLHSFCHVLFCISHARSSYRKKPSRELEKLCEFSFVLAENILKQCLVERTDSLFSTQHVQEVAEIVFCHPLVGEILEFHLSSDKTFEDAVFMGTRESFLEFARQGVNKVDHQVLNLLKTTSELVVYLSHNNGSLSDVDHADKRTAKAVKVLGEKLILKLKDRFSDSIRSKDLMPLIPTLYALHSLIDFIVPIELLDLVNWLFSMINLNDTTTSLSLKKSALSIGLHIAGCAFDSLLSDVVQPNSEGTVKYLFKGIENRSCDVVLFEGIFFQIFEITTSFELDVADHCLLKALKVVKFHKDMEKRSLPFIMTVSRLVTSVPVNFLSHCMDNITKSKAELLFLLCEMSPLHLSVFGNLFSKMNECPLFNANNLEEDWHHPCSYEQFLMLLPTVLLYLNSAYMKFGSLLSGHLRNILSFFSRILLHSFSNWKRFVCEDMFDVKFVQCLPSSMEEFLNLVSASLLGRAIVLMQHYFALCEHSVKLKNWVSLFDSVSPPSSSNDDLLDCDISEVNVSSLDQPLNFANRIVAKIRFCRLLLFPEHSQFQSQVEEDRCTRNTSEMSSSRIRFLDMLVHSWQQIVKKFHSDPGNSRIGEESSCSVFRFLEIFIANSILELIAEMRGSLIKLHSLPIVEQLAKYSLLYRFDDPPTLKILRTVLASLSEGKFSCISILQLLVAHSQFTQALLSIHESSVSTQLGLVFTPTPSIIKSHVFPQIEQIALNRKNNLSTSGLHVMQLELVKLLRVLFQMKNQQCDSDVEACSDINLNELVLLLLSSYGATLTEIDLEIYLLINDLESSYGSVTESIAEIDYLWGFAAKKVRKERVEELHICSDATQDAEAVAEIRRIQFRENFPIDPKSCERTVLFFPYDISTGQGSLNKSHKDDFHEECAGNDEKRKIYNPFFILRFSIHCLSAGYIEPLEFSSLGLLAITFMSLSSPDGDLRKLGYEVLGIFKSSLEKCQKRKEVMRLRLLLSYLQNGIIEPLQRISSVTAVFAAEASCVLLDSSHDHYSAISKTLTRSPGANMKGIPLFEDFFWSSSVTFKAERLWMLRLLNTALNTDNDAQIYIRNSIFETLLDFYVSPLSDDESKGLIIQQMVKKSIKLHKLARYLIEQCGIISWFSSLLSSFCGSLCKDQRSFPLARFGVVLQVVNDAISLRNTSEWLQKYALEQLAELSSHLYRHLVGYIASMKEQTTVVDLILQILISTLKISQKRKVYQPHFTLSFEGLYQLCGAVDACCIERFSHVAVFGLKTVLMSTPRVTIFDMDQEKLVKFLSWTISTAVQSHKVSQSESLDLNTTFAEEHSEESLVSKLLRWLTASVILGRLSWKLHNLDYSCHFERSKLCNLQSLLDYTDKGSGEHQKGCGCEDMLAMSIFYLQQLVGIKCKFLPSVVSALSLLLFSAPSSSELHSLLGDGFPLASLFLKIRYPAETNPSWRWSFYQPWKDLSSESTDLEKIEEIHASQMLLVAISKKLGKRNLYSQYLSLENLENFNVFKWERSIIESR